LLGFQPLNEKYIVKDIKFKEKEVKISVETLIISTTCPKCGHICDKKKDTKIRELNHGYINGLKCTIKLKYIRYKCSGCNSSFYESITDICEKYYRHTNVAINNLKNNLGDLKISVASISKMNNMNVKLINKLYSIKVHEMKLNNIVTLPPNIGIDEFKGNMKVSIDGKRIKIKYQIQITNLDTSEIVALIPVKDEKSIRSFLRNIKNKKDVKNVVIDMSMQFKRLFKLQFKNAAISVDNFHVTKLVVTAVDKIRLELWRKYVNDKSELAKEIRKYLKSLKPYLLTDFIACKNEKYKVKITEKLNKIFAYTPELKGAYDKLQEFYNIKRLQSSDDKISTFKNWLHSIDIKVLSTFKSVKKTMFHWFTYIKNAFVTGFSNGKTEGNNNSIKVLKRVSYGFVNFENAVNRILVTC
jgi:transposase